MGDRRAEADERGEEIRRELRFARKQPYGMTAAVMAECPLLCSLLGDGDPDTALAELSERLRLAAQAERDPAPIEAAMYTLGITSGTRTVLGRLSGFAAENYIEQRQARRYSDKGIEQAALLVLTSSPLEFTPELRVVVRQVDGRAVAMSLRTKRPRGVEMGTVEVGAWQTGDWSVEPTQGLSLEWSEETPTDEDAKPDPDGRWLTRRALEDVRADMDGTLAVRFLWPGDLWPKFSVVVVQPVDAKAVKTEILGAACAISWFHDKADEDEA